MERYTRKEVSPAMSLFSRLGALLLGDAVEPNYPICSEQVYCGYCCSDRVRKAYCDARTGYECECRGTC